MSCVWHAVGTDLELVFVYIQNGTKVTQHIRVYKIPKIGQESPYTIYQPKVCVLVHGPHCYTESRHVGSESGISVAC